MADLLHRAAGTKSRGIHPAILSKVGLGTGDQDPRPGASVVPVRLAVDVDRRLPESTEATAYQAIRN